NTTRQSLVYARDMRAMFQRLKDANAELKRLNSQLQQLSDLKSSFLSVIGHELRSPFVDLNLALQSFGRYGTDRFTAEQRDLLASIETSSKRAFQRVDKLVKYVHLLSKRGTLHLGDFEVSEMIEEVVSALEPTARRKRQELKVNVLRQTAYHADRELIAEALWHVLHNAVRFTPNGGHIEISARNEPDYLVFEVKDDGPGIPDSKQAGLWEPFEQMADAVLRSEEGLGLGLPLVRYAATAHGGEAFMQSKENVGSVVGFWIPHQPETVSAG
ncbi:MAG: HAMP domain-containing histidine kinase, partial [Anaerolineae bacterium]|nr:HAMP domain-containing histidine kinase [Anaerolineae bacterium]